MLKLVAFLFALAVASPPALARRMPVPAPAPTILAIDHRNKVDTDHPESHFELRADGTWRYLRTVKQAIAVDTRGKLARAQLRRIRLLLAQAPWRVTQDGVACMAFATSNTQFTVNGRAVWTDEMCSGKRLDRTSAKKLERVQRIVDAILPDES